MKLKQSYYNFVYDDLGKDQIVFYNSRTGSLAVVRETQYKQFTDFINSGIEIEDTEFLTNLLKCGYLLPEGVDERYLIKTRMMKGCYSNHSLTLTIAPTMACNFRCVYCFEQGHYGNKLMERKTQDDLIRFIKNRLSGVEHLFITWFGGEPLLGMQVIENLSKQIIEICNEKNIEYSASIITNGYLLDKCTAEKLKEYQVKAVQITVDGPKELHDVRRPMIDGRGTYDAIIKNLIEIQNDFIIALRINVDIDNIRAADKIIYNLKELGISGRIRPSLGYVTSCDDNYRDICFSIEQYSKENLSFMMKHSIPLQSSFPLPKTHNCCADSVCSWVVDDEGYLYKCWEEIGNKKYAVGNISDVYTVIQHTELLQQYTSFDPMSDSLCSDCKYLPICLGGCPHKRLQGQFQCTYLKFCMQNYMCECTKSILDLKQRSAKTVVSDEEKVGSQ